MPNDYIPRPDARFHGWQNDFVTYFNRHPTDLRLALGDAVDLSNSGTTWTTDYLAHTATACNPFMGGTRVGMAPGRREGKNRWLSLSNSRIIDN